MTPSSSSARAGTLFRTQRYGKNAQTPSTVEGSRDFGVDDDRCRSQLDVAAPEIVQVDGQDYMAYLLPA